MKKSRDKASLQQLFEQGAELIEVALHHMNQAIVALCEQDGQAMHEATQQTILNEKALDKIHDNIVSRLFTREALVFSREDRLYIANGIDEIVDKAEVVVRRASIYTPNHIPQELVPRLIAISERAKIIGTLISEASIAIFYDFQKASGLVENIEDIRREAKQDDLYFLQKLYALNLETRDFLYFDHLIHNIMQCIDEANTFADGLERLIAKYHF